jgi:class 3 adenylate cyclase
VNQGSAIEPPETRYARSGELAIAYQVVGDGPVDLVFCPFNLNLFYSWHIPQFAGFLRRLATFSRLILFDHRGTGLSDRPRDLPTLEARMDDIRTVMDAAGSEQSALLGVLEGGHVAALFAATYPERASALILFNPTARGLRAPDYPWGLSSEEWRARLKEIREGWGTQELSNRFAASMYPSLADDEDFLEHLVAYTRLWASPGAAHTYFRMAMETDVRDVLPAVRVPTLVLYRQPFRDQSLDVAGRVLDAKVALVPGNDAAISPGIEPAAEVERFLFESELEAERERVLATILFTDIVRSTERAVELGDSRWRALLERHHAVIRQQLAHFRGNELDTAGDGFFASFEGPARAIRCACAITEAVKSLGLEVRAGLHTGECELVDGKVAGIAVHTCARVASHADSGEVLVSSTVKDLVAGSGIEFEDRAEHELTGIPGTWHLYAVVR